MNQFFLWIKFFYLSVFSWIRLFMYQFFHESIFSMYQFFLCISFFMNQFFLCISFFYVSVFSWIMFFLWISFFYASFYSCLHVCAISAPPKANVPPRFADIAIFEKGETAVIKIPFTGNPKPTAKWIRDGVEITSGDRYTVDIGERHAILTINRTDKVDDGPYRLQLENDLGSDSAVIKIAINGELTLSLSYAVVWILILSRLFNYPENSHRCFLSISSIYNYDDHNLKYCKFLEI